tara:strand:- start:680 stop:1093 length:414 start_codon:yes stop_codon:yes gene_type:complete
MSSDPKYIGPGYWTAWHIKSLHADDKNKKSEVARSIVVDIIYFPCMNCRNHAKDYVRKNPLMEAIKKDDPLSLFIWTVNFHNFVNMRLGKTMINWQQAKKLWSGENVCFENCGMDEEEKGEEEKGEEEKGEMMIKNY